MQLRDWSVNDRGQLLDLHSCRSRLVLFHTGKSKNAPRRGVSIHFADAQHEAKKTFGGVWARMANKDFSAHRFTRMELSDFSLTFVVRCFAGCAGVGTVPILSTLSKTSRVSSGVKPTAN